MKEFRQLTVDDAAEYHEVLIAGYAENKNYPISFDAINFSPEESRAWILKYPVFGLYVDGSLVCSISFRMPWIPKATPDVYPHIAHFVTAPEHKGQGYAREVLAEAEDLLRNVYKTPAVPLVQPQNIHGLPKCMKALALKNISEYNCLEKYILLYSLRRRYKDKKISINLIFELKESHLIGAALCCSIRYYYHSINFKITLELFIYGYHII